MAIVYLVVLLVALGIGALISLEFWQADTVDPRPGVGSGRGLEGAVGEATAVTSGERLAIAPVQPAPGVGPGFAAREVDALAVEGGSPEHLAVAPAQVVGRSEPVAPPVAQPGPPATESPPSTQPSPVPEVVPVASPVPSASPPQGVPAQPGRSTIGRGGSGPGTAGGPAPSEGFVSGPVRVDEGGEYALGFSLRLQPTAYRAPGEDNLIARVYDEVSGEHSLGLQLWDDGSGTQRGLWASGDAMGGERFLAPLAEGVWHRIVVSFEASSEEEGFYLVLLDGEPIDAGAWVSLIDPASGYSLLEAGLFRDGKPVDGAPDVAFEPARTGTTLESVIP